MSISKLNLPYIQNMNSCGAELSTVNLKVVWFKENNMRTNFGD